MKSQDHGNRHASYTSQDPHIIHDTHLPSRSELSFSPPQGTSIRNPFVIPSNPTTPTTDRVIISSSPTCGPSGNGGRSAFESQSSFVEGQSLSLLSPGSMVREREPPRAPLSPTKANPQLAQSSTSPSALDSRETMKMAQSESRPDVGRAQPEFGRPTQLGSKYLPPSNREQPSSGPKPEDRLFHKPNTSYNPLQFLQTLGNDRIPPSNDKSQTQPSLYASRPGVPIQPPLNPTYTTQVAAERQFTSKPYNSRNGPSSTLKNIIDLTGGSTSGTQAHEVFGSQFDEFEPGVFVDSAKAHENIKSLLEGAFEDEEDKPRTRMRKRKIDVATAELADKLKGMSVNGEEQGKAAEEEAEEFDGTVEGLRVKLLPHQIEGYEWMREKENGMTKTRGVLPKGGILADDMGLGKTIQSIALIMTNPKPSEAEIEEMQASKQKNKRSLPLGLNKGTLVVAPLALIKQWEAEIRDKVEDSQALKVCVHHGPQRAKRSQDLKKYDVVITTYNTLTSEHAASNDTIRTGCYGLRWYRIVLDEAHSIKNRTAKQTQAACALQAEYRWCLTGTPMQNNLDELQSLIKFLRIKPYDELPAWREHITKPMNNGRGGLAIKRLQVYLKAFMKRRTKDILQKEGALQTGGRTSKTGDEGEQAASSFKVVKRTVERIETEFSPAERAFYNRLEQRADKSLKRMMAGDTLTYASALTLLLRLRQVCNHPTLAKTDLSQEKDGLETLRAGAQTPRKKAAVRDEDVDGLTSLMGGLGVNAKNCDFCQVELSAKEVSAGMIRCAGCEADLEDDAMTPSKKNGKKKKKFSNGSGLAKPTRKPRNRRIVTDSDDDDDEEDGEGEWLVPEDRRGNVNLSRTGGTDDENAEGGGIWLGSDDSEIGADETFGSSEGGKKKKNVTSLNTDDEDENEKDEDSSSDSANIEHDDDDDDDDDEEDSSSVSDDDDTEKSKNLIISTKIRHLLHILERDSVHHKYIVFSFFTSMLSLIEPFLRQSRIAFTRYDGQMRNDAREASLNKLRTDSKCRVLLCSLKAGSLGLNLTAASRVVILEPFWNPFVEEQAIDRVHRLNQTKDVAVYKLTVRGTVEERILDLQERKRELANATIEGGKKGAEGAKKLSMKEMLALFKMDDHHHHYDHDHDRLEPEPGQNTESVLGHGHGQREREREGEGAKLTGRSSNSGTDAGAGAEREGSEGPAERESRKGGRFTVQKSINTAAAGRSQVPRRKEDDVYGRRW